MIRLGLPSLLLAGCFFTPDRPSGVQGDAGGADATGDTMPDGRVLPDDRNYMFVTSATYTASAVRDPATADNICKGVAAAAGLPNAPSFVAWISADLPQQDARMRLSGRGWYRTDGQPFADKVGDFLDSGLTLYPPRLDERAKLVPDDSIVLTGTSSDGYAGATCSEDVAFTYGVPDGGHIAWTSYGTANCFNGVGHLYCFGTGKDVPVVLAPPTNSLRAFLSNSTVTGSAGRDALSAVCRSDASTHSLNGNFVALAATPQMAANMQVETDGRAWYRLDGVFLADKDLMTFEAPLDVTPTTRLDTSLVYVGAPSPGVTGSYTSTCDNWSGGTTIYGDSTRSTSEAFAGGLEGGCDSAGHVYCFETTGTPQDP